MIKLSCKFLIKKMGDFFLFFVLSNLLKLTKRSTIADVAIRSMAEELRSNQDFPLICVNRCTFSV